MEKKGDRDEKVLSTKIALLLGKGNLKDFENGRDPEISDFRLAMVDKCKKAVEFHNPINDDYSSAWDKKVLYCYPPDTEASMDKNQLIMERLHTQVSQSVNNNDDDDDNDDNNNNNDNTGKA